MREPVIAMEPDGVEVFARIEMASNIMYTRPWKSKTPDAIAEFEREAWKEVEYCCFLVDF